MQAGFRVFGKIGIELKESHTPLSPIFFVHVLSSRREGQWGVKQPFEQNKRLLIHSTVVLQSIPHKFPPPRYGLKLVVSVL